MGSLSLEELAGKRREQRRNGKNAASVTGQAGR